MIPKNKAVYSVNAELLDANWQTGQHIVEFEPGGNAKAKYGDRVVDLCNIWYNPYSICIRVYREPQQEQYLH